MVSEEEEKDWFLLVERSDREPVLAPITSISAPEQALYNIPH